TEPAPSGTPDAVARATAHSSNGRTSDSRNPTLPSTKIASTPSASNTRRTARTAETRVVFSGLYGITPPKNAITRFLNPRLKSASLGPNQVIRGRAGTTDVTIMGYQPEWWVNARRKGAAGHWS